MVTWLQIGRQHGLEVGGFELLGFIREAWLRLVRDQWLAWLQVDDLEQLDFFREGWLSLVKDGWLTWTKAGLGG